MDEYILTHRTRRFDATVILFVDLIRSDPICFDLICFDYLQVQENKKQRRLPSYGICIEHMSDTLLMASKLPKPTFVFLQNLFNRSIWEFNLHLLGKEEKPPKSQNPQFAEPP